MPFTIDPAVINAMDDGAVAHAWMIDLFTDEGTLRAWDKPFSVTYLSNTYEALADSWEINGEIKLGSDLVPEPLTFTFDGSADENDTSFAGRLVDRSWHQRRIKLTGLLFVPGQNFLTPIGPHLEWFGTMDTLEKVEVEDAPARIVMSCEGGIFRALDRNMTTCTDADQKRRDPADLFFRNVALKPQQDVPFGRAWGTIPGGSGRGDVGGGGGSITGGGGRARVF